MNMFINENVPLNGLDQGLLFFYEQNDTDKPQIK